MVTDEQLRAVRRESATQILDAFEIPDPMRAFVLAQLDEAPSHGPSDTSDRAVERRLAAADA